MNPETIVQLISAVGWRVHIDSPSVSFKNIVCFALTSGNRVVPLVVGDTGDSIVELFSISGANDGKSTSVTGF